MFIVVSALAALMVSPAHAGDPRNSLMLGGVECGLIPTTTGAEAAPPVGAAVRCPGVRPGATVLSPTGQCSFNFMWRDQSGHRYMGTAGHCIIDSGERTWVYGSGPVARNSAGQRVGEFVYAILSDPKDFALIRLDAGATASPQMCHFGGPTAQNDDLTSNRVVIHHFGQGLALGATVPGRTAVANNLPSPDHVHANGAAVFGDSGSGAISADGRALGVVVTIGVHVGSNIYDHGFIGMTRLKPQVQRAQQLLQVTLTLQTAPLL